MKKLELQIIIFGLILLIVALMVVFWLIFERIKKAPSVKRKVLDNFGKHLI